VTHFFIPQLLQIDIDEQLAKVGRNNFIFTEGHKKEFALQRYFNSNYVYKKDSKPFYQHCDIESKQASVKSSGSTLFINGKIINDTTSVEDAVEYYISNCVAQKYYIVLQSNKWIPTPKNHYLVIELNKKEMKKLLLKYGCTDRDSKAHRKNALRLKRTDSVITKWYRLERI